jgi:hypothetical protein
MLSTQYARKCKLLEEWVITQREVGDFMHQWGSYAQINLSNDHCKHKLVRINMGEYSKTVTDCGSQLRYSTSSYCKYYQCVCVYVYIYISLLDVRGRYLIRLVGFFNKWFIRYIYTYK